MQDSSFSFCKPGAGLRSVHFPELEERPPKVIKWFEALSENYLDTFGRPLKILEMIRKDFPIALHGVSLSIGSAHGLDKGYLSKLKGLIDTIDPFIISDHLCWTSTAAGNTHDLLPLPYTEEALQLLIERIDEVQNFLKKPIVLENPSSYMTFKHSTYSEWDFLKAISDKSGAKILLDMNNVYVSSVNHGFDPYKYLNAIPGDIVAQIHLAGFTDMGTYLFDTHSKPVHTKVWNLFCHYIQKNPQIPFMVEWDDNIPSLTELEEELSKAVSIWEKCHESKGSTP
ncbi:MAG: DUF692 domain-containing protein [Oligoflexales bacterium]|nr:DUF692 domain-containing protein [Oligoflexales bacterium]